MGLDKKTYVDGKTLILAKNLNEIQDTLISLENTVAETQEHVSEIDSSLTDLSNTVDTMNIKLELVTYTMSVSAEGALSYATDVPSPSSIKSSMLDAGRFPYIKLFDRYWLDGGDKINGHMSVVYLPYVQREYFAGDTFCTFETTAVAPTTDTLYYVRIKGLELNGSTTWTIEKRPLAITNVQGE